MSFALNVPTHISSLYGADLVFHCSRALPLIFFNCATPALSNVLAENESRRRSAYNKNTNCHLFTFLARVSIIFVSHRLVKISLAESRIVAVFCLRLFELQIPLVVLKRLQVL